MIIKYVYVIIKSFTVHRRSTVIRPERSDFRFCIVIVFIDSHLLSMMCVIIHSFLLSILCVIIHSMLRDVPCLCCVLNRLFTVIMLCVGCLFRFVHCISPAKANYPHCVLSSKLTHTSTSPTYTPTYTFTCTSDAYTHIHIDTHRERHLPPYSDLQLFGCNDFQ